MVLDILIAEDNEYTAKQYKIALEKRNHKVTITKDGVECIDQYMNDAKYGNCSEKTDPRHLILFYWIMICQEKQAQTLHGKFWNVAPIKG
jgi:hypothetical protein